MKYAVSEGFDFRQTGKTLREAIELGVPGAKEALNEKTLEPVLKELNSFGFRIYPIKYALDTIDEWMPLNPELFIQEKTIRAVMNALEPFLYRALEENKSTFEYEDSVNIAGYPPEDARAD